MLTKLQSMPQQVFSQLEQLQFLFNVAVPNKVLHAGLSHKIDQRAAALVDADLWKWKTGYFLLSPDHTCATIARLLGLYRILFENH